ncbi:pseudouridine synthase [Oscillospiraceae bacterium PP1C4]
MGMKKGLDRLDKAIAAQTQLSRKDVHRLLSRGQILVNGETTRNFDTRIDLENDEVTIEGQPLVLKRHSYIMMNKPQGVVSATSDAALPTVLDLVPEELRRNGLFPAGRLDKDTTGFVLITNDGDFAHRILAPKSHVPKIYTATLDKPVDDGIIAAFKEGVVLKAEKHIAQRLEDCPARRDKSTCMPARLEIVNGDPTVVRVLIRQGMYHQIKRMFGAFDIEVVGLHRDQIGGLALDLGLESGKCRELSKIEVEKITNTSLE